MSPEVKHPVRRSTVAGLALLVVASQPVSLQSQGMSSSGAKALPPVPLPDGLELPRTDFVDVAQAAGLAFSRRVRGPLQPATYLPETTGTGVAIIDYDRDGLPDLFFVGSGRSAGDERGSPHRLFRNLGELRFRDVSTEAGLASTGWGQGVCAGDFDRDGFTDLFVTQWGHDVLLRNLEGAGFRDEAHERGVSGEARRWSTGCSFLDYDRDGDLDLFVAHYVDFEPEITPLPGDAPQCTWKGAPIPCGPRGLAAESMSLFANAGSGRFVEVTSEAGVSTAPRYHGLGVLSSDLDSDGWVDVFVACDSTANLVFRNLGHGGFEEVGLISAAAYNEDGHEQAGMGVAAADYDGDGRVDVFQTNFADDTNTIYRNSGGLAFRDRTAQAGLATVTRQVGWGTVFIDFDRDGWADLFAVNGHVSASVENAGIDETFAQPRLLFWNRGDGIFHSLADAAGPGIGARHSSRGAAASDLDRDGALEIVVVNMGEPPSLLQNQVEARGNWLAVRAVSKSGADAVGARVTVDVGSRTLVGEVRSGGSYLSQSDFQLHFGLGVAESASVSVRWPSGSTSPSRKVSANEFVIVREHE